MPPIPNKFPEEVLSLISSVERRYKYISESSVSELRRCTGPLSLQQRLADDVREDTLALSRQIEALDMMVDDQQGDKNRRELRAIVSDFQLKLETLKKDTRAALLASKRAIDTSLRSRREELLARPAVYDEKQTANEKTSEDALMQANSDVTDALRRTLSLMQAELERSVLSSQLLDESTASLRSTSLQHDTLTSVMSTSKHLVTALEKSDWLDRILILSGFGFFILVVLFILKQRIVDRGIRLAFWWTRFVPAFTTNSVLLKSAEKGIADSLNSVKSISSNVASITTALVSTASIAPILPSVLTSSVTAVPVSSAVSSAVQESPTSISIAVEADDAPSSTTDSDAPSIVQTATSEPDFVHIEL